MVTDTDNKMYNVFYLPFKGICSVFRLLSVWQDKLHVPQAYSNKFFIVTGSVFSVKWWKCFQKKIPHRSKHFVQTDWQFCRLCSTCDLYKIIRAKLNPVGKHFQKSIDWSVHPVNANDTINQRLTKMGVTTFAV